jgi:glycyl-tRNA synthetase
VTVDDQTIEAGTVTVRHRDSMHQDVVKLEELESYIASRIKF